MDFFQFLKNSSNDKNDSEKKSKVTKEKTSKTGKKESTIVKNDDKKLKTDQTIDIDREQVSVYKNIMKGDMVKIVRIEGSLLNSYKGYVGEIREYKRDQNTAVVFLHSISSNNRIRFPIDHFIKM
jgi:hypothetical protein